MCRTYVLHYVTMASRVKQPVVRRPSLPLTDADEADLELLRSSAAHRSALARLSPAAPAENEDLTEGALLHAILQAGIAAVRTAAETQGYQQLAAEYASRAHQRRATARRKAPVWADET